MPGELRPGVDDRDPIAHQLGQAVQRNRDVDGTDDDEVRSPAERLDEPITVSSGQAGHLRIALDHLDLTADQVGAHRGGLVFCERGDQALLRRCKWLHEDLDVPAAGKPDLEGNVIRDAESGDLRLARLQHLLGLLEDGALDAPVADRSGHLPGPRDGHGGPERTGAGAPGLDHSGEGDLLTGVVPLPQLVKDLAHLGSLYARGAAIKARQQPAEVVEGLHVVRGEKVVAVRQGRRHATRERLISL